VSVIYTTTPGVWRHRSWALSNNAPITRLVYKYNDLSGRKAS
jgi:hypothetical protein